MRFTMKKIIYFVLISPLLLIGCSMMDNNSNKTSQSVPDEMPASRYVGQGFQPKAEKSAVEYAKKHRKEYEKLGEQFFKDNFSLNVKATNVVGSGDGVEVYVHCDDHDIVFNASIPFDKESIHEKGSMRSHDNSDDMSNMVGTVLSGFEYRANQEKLDNLTSFFRENEDNYSYTGFTKQAVTKTQVGGFKNQYYYISAVPYSISEYRKHFEPLINKNDSEFVSGMKKAKKELNDKSKPYLTTTFFSTKKNFSKDNSTDDILNLADKLKRNHSIPHNFNMQIQLSDSKINPFNPSYSKKDTIKYGVFNHESN